MPNPNPLDAATLRAVLREYKPGREGETFTLWLEKKLEAASRLAAPVGEKGEDINRDCHICPTCTCYGGAESREQVWQQATDALIAVVEQLEALNWDGDKWLDREVVLAALRAHQTPETPR